MKNLRFESVLRGIWWSFWMFALQQLEPILKKGQYRIQLKRLTWWCSTIQITIWWTEEKQLAVPGRTNIINGCSPDPGLSRTLNPLDTALQHQLCALRYRPIVKIQWYCILIPTNILVLVLWTIVLLTNIIGSGCVWVNARMFQNLAEIIASKPIIITETVSTLFIQKKHRPNS